MSAMTHNAKYLVFKRPSTRATIERIARARRWTLEQAGEEAAQLLAAREGVVESHSTAPSSKNSERPNPAGEMSARESVAAEERTSANIPVAPLPGREQDSTSVS